MSGGGLGENLPPDTYSYEETSYRTIFDLSFFILVTIIGLNVVFGIIVDTFSEVRVVQVISSPPPCDHLLEGETSWPLVGVSHVYYIVER